MNGQEDENHYLMSDHTGATVNLFGLLPFWACPLYDRRERNMRQLHGPPQVDR